MKKILTKLVIGILALMCIVTMINIYICLKNIFLNFADIFKFGEE